MDVTSVTGRESLADISRQLEGQRTSAPTTAEFQNLLQQLVVHQPLAGFVSTGPRAGSGTPPLLSGFDLQRVAWDQTSKYQFARAAAQFSLNSVHDGTSAQALLESMRPALESAGLSVLDVQNDRLKIMQEGHEQWVEVIRGAASGMPAFTWLPR